ncbi:MAG: shikimate dehydrogenase [Opitutaceae bacterium]
MPDDVLTLEDLRTWSAPGTALAVLGHPIRHSVSPPMHNTALAEMARTRPEFRDWRYHRFEVHPDDLPVALELLHGKRFLGINLTVPHKILAVDLIRRVDPSALPINAVNTLLWQPGGYVGFNTDGYGLAEGLRHDLKLELGSDPVILLGSGGAARGAAIECLQRGCREIAIGNRTRRRADELTESLRALHPSAAIRTFDPAAPPADLPPDALVINATSAGLKPADPEPIDLSRLRGRPCVFDMIYNPPETALLRSARRAGLACANGFSMLIFQGVRSLGIWSKAEVPVDAMFRGARAGLTPS